MSRVMMRLFEFLNQFHNRHRIALDVHWTSEFFYRRCNASNKTTFSIGELTHRNELVDIGNKDRLKQNRYLSFPYMKSCTCKTAPKQSIKLLAKFESRFSASSFFPLQKMWREKS